MVTLSASGSGVQFPVRAQPKASRNTVVGVQGDRLKVAVTAAPSGGKANRAIERVLAKALGVRSSAVEVVSGRTARDKLIRVAGLSVKEAERRLGDVLAGREE